VEAGQLEASAGLPVAARALNEAIELGKPSYMMDGVRALLALLAGDPQLAVRLARLACDSNDDSLGRADDLATLARAYMAAGDNSAARRALAQAERLVPWWPRVALTRRRLDLA
jgi:ATP/maltotriose-dependent transcriptional regulator MalT